jgi:hypothetical protein
MGEAVVLACLAHRLKLAEPVAQEAAIDRLSRDAHFLLGLQKAGVSFVAADMSEANALTVGIMALVAEQEREEISRRTPRGSCSRRRPRRQARLSERRGSLTPIRERPRRDCSQGSGWRKGGRSHRDHRKPPGAKAWRRRTELPRHSMSARSPRRAEARERPVAY